MRSLGDFLLGSTMTLLLGAPVLGAHAARAETNAPQPRLAGDVAARPAPSLLAPANLPSDDVTGSVPKAAHDADIVEAAPATAVETPVGAAEPVRAPSAKRNAPAAAKAGKDADGGPDDVVTPVKALPSRDPLDALTQPAPNPSIPNKPAQPAEATPADAPNAQPTAAAPVEALPPLNAAIKTALDARDAEPLKGAHVTERRKERAAIAFFYAAHGFAPVWSSDGKPVAAVPSVLDRLARADEDALAIAAPPKGLVATGSNDAIASGDIALTEALVDYARQATGSRVDPRVIGPLIGSLPTLADPGEVIEAVIAAGTGGGDALRALNPKDPRYVALRDALAAMRKPHAAARPIPEGRTLRIGMHDPRVPMLRARFGLDISVDPDFEADVYDHAVAEAVSGFQRTNGLPVTGTLNPRTVAALSDGGGASPKTQGTVIANMEMWRWMPRDLGADRIEVNIPDYKVTVFHAGQPVTEHRVVVGKPDTPTPLFSNTMKYLIVNPYWNVPQSIIRNEMLPKGGGSLDYLDGRGYSVSYRGGTATVKQLPGEKNALGRIKFLFPNDYSVYLHDTPSKALFSSAKRAFSHGCVRVDQPFAFGAAVLNDAAPDAGRKVWSEERLTDMIGDKERYVNLPTPLPIHIEYFTASVDPASGKLRQRDDVYGYAHAVASALGQESDAVPVAGRNKPKPLPMAQIVRRHRLPAEPGAEQTAAATAPAQASRGFWGMIFDPR